MKIFLIKRKIVADWDQYNSFICVADSKEDAIELNPDGTGKYRFDNPEYNDWGELCNSWVVSKDELDIIEIGEANENQIKNTILLSQYFS